MKNTLRLILAFTGLVLFFSLFNTKIETPVAFGYGYGYYGNNVDVGYKSKEVSSRKTKLKKISLKFENLDYVAQYRISKHSDFSGAEWQTIADKAKVSVSDKNGEITRFYIQFKDNSGELSNVVTKSVTYSEHQKRQIKTSSKKVSRNQVVSQKGKNFSKNSDVAVYFSKFGGGFYKPMNIKTDKRGNFNLNYKVVKPKGTYYWYALDLKTKKKSSFSYYHVIN